MRFKIIAFLLRHQGFQCFSQAIAIETYQELVESIPYIHALFLWESFYYYLHITPTYKKLPLVWILD
jgi:hypothetical protein